MKDTCGQCILFGHSIDKCIPCSLTSDTYCQPDKNIHKINDYSKPKKKYFILLYFIEKCHQENLDQKKSVLYIRESFISKSVISEVDFIIKHFNTGSTVSAPSPSQAANMVVTTKRAKYLSLIDNYEFEHPAFELSDVF